MINKKQTLNKKEKESIRMLLNSLEDKYNDFYITVENKRIFLKEKQNYKKLFNCLRKGDTVIFNEKGIILVIGYSDKSFRKYVKILAEDKDTINNLVKVLLWENIKIDLYAKLKRDNIAINVLKNNGWEFYKSRGRELLLVRRV